jgi:glucose-6-phosphate 1-dehydrogenase
VTTALVPEKATSLFCSPTTAPTLEAATIVLFGATGDLAKRKLLPGLFHLSVAGLLPDEYRIIAASIEDLSRDAFVEHALSVIDEFGRAKPTGDAWDEFVSRLDYVGGGFGPGQTHDLASVVTAAGDELGSSRKLFFCAVPPVAFSAIAQGLGESGLNEDARVILEKPFGTDLTSARELNALVHSVLDESQIYRIDHFLGKEAVQNLLAFRFANGLFEPVWNREFVDHIQLDVPETLSIGTRAGFYEATGALRDMVVTHLFQVLGFVAMEPPASLTPKQLVDEKVKVFQAMRELDPARVVRGQYDGYLDEPGVAPGSQTETFVAGEVFVDNWRWAGVPFYFRTGKSLPAGKRQLTITFKQPPLALFERADVSTTGASPNRIVFDLGDDAAISATFLAKAPGTDLRLREAHLDFRTTEQFDGDGLLEAYERLIHDALIGDHTLFTRADGIERLWEVVTPVLDNPAPVQTYANGSWGPDAVHELIAPHAWALPAA